VELPDEPDTDGGVEEDQDPVACQDEDDGDQELKPQLGNVPKVQSSTAFLGI